MRNRLLKFLLFAALLGGFPGTEAIHAQDQDQLQQQDDQSAAQAQEQEQEQEQAQREQTEAQEESTEETEENEGFERFIPTEQVSRELGVSFPADI